MVTSSEQGKSKKKRAARVKIQTLQAKILYLQAGIATPPDGEYHHQRWDSIVEETKVRIEEYYLQCQEIENKMNDNEFSNDDESIGSVTHIPTETGVNNSDAESMSMDGNDNGNNNEDDQRYHANNGMYEEELSTKDNMEINKDKNEENRSDGDGKRWMITS